MRLLGRHDPDLLSGFGGCDVNDLGSIFAMARYLGRFGTRRGPLREQLYLGRQTFGGNAYFTIAPDADRPDGAAGHSPCLADGRKSDE